MKANPQPTDGLPGTTMAALLLAIFTVSVEFGIILPLLPYLIERLLGAGAETAQIARHTGLLTAVYTLALFLFAPAWGWFSDRHGPRVILLTGLFGLGVTMLVFSSIENIVAIYVERFLSGLFAAAVTPVAAAAIGDFPMSEEARGRRLAFLSMAGIIGFLLGPMLGVFITRFALNFFAIAIAMPAGSTTIPLLAGALLAFMAASTVAYAVPGNKIRDRSRKEAASVVDGAATLMPRLFMLSFIVSAGVGAFEVGLVLLGKQELNLTPYQIALMFSECSLVMFAMQAIVFSPWVKPSATRLLIAPALAVLAAGLFVVPWAPDFLMMLIVIGAVAASAGILSPILTYWISAKAGNAQGWELGKQAAAASLGVAAGSAAGGVFFNAGMPGASFLIAAVLTVLGFLLSFGLPHALMPRRPGMGMAAASLSHFAATKEK